MKNNVSFDEKQRVVLLKTTCRFVENNVSFVGQCRNGSSSGEKCEKKSNTRGRRKGECDTCDSKKSTSLLEGARARVRAKEVLLDNDVEEWCQSQLSCCLLALKCFMDCFCLLEKAK